MGHQHLWCDEPPDEFNRTFEERYGDEEDMAHNSYWTSPDELQLRLAHAGAVVFILLYYQVGEVST